MPPVSLTLTRRPDGWWIIGLPVTATNRELGPYQTKAEADEDRRGVERFINNNLEEFEP